MQEKIGNVTLDYEYYPGEDHATRLSANELLQEVKLAEKTIMDIINSN